MATISAPDLVLLRTTQHKITPYLSVLKPRTLLTARINNGAITRGARTIAFDGGVEGYAGSFADIEANQTLWIGESAGTYNVGKVRIKSIAGAAAAGSISIAENGFDFVDDLYLTITQNYEIWPIPPRISGGIFYKDYDLTYAGVGDPNEEPNPVAIAGTHRAGFLDPVTGEIAFDLDGSDSYVIADGAAISTYLWQVAGPAAAVITNANIATTVITFDTAGQYWVSLTVTDDNGKSQKTYRAYFIHSIASPPYRNFTIGNLSGDWSGGGWSANIKAFGAVTLADFPDNTLAVLWYDNYFDDAEDYVNVWGVSNEVLCAGYVQTESDSDDLDNGDGDVSFSIVTPDALLAKRTEMGSVSIEAVSTDPSYWYEYESWLTVGRSVHHLLKWHSTVMETCDVYGLLDNTLGMKQAQFVEDSLLARINGLANARGIFARMNSDRLGRLHLVEDSQFLDETDRAAQDTVFNLLLADLSGTISLGREPIKQTAMAFLDGFSFDGSVSIPLISIIPGYIDSVSLQIPEFEGSGTINRTRQVLGSEADSNMKVGRVLADANNPLRELRATLRGNYTGAFDIIPSLGWYGWGVANATFKRNLSLLNTRWLCRRVELSFSFGDVFSGDLETTIILEGEAFGPDGLPANYPTGYPTPTPPDPNWTPKDTPNTTAGFWVGGYDGAGDDYNSIDSIIFATDVISAIVATLTTPGAAYSGVSNSTTYGYMAGFFTYDITDYKADADRITFLTAVVTANAVSNLSSARGAAVGLSDKTTYGYFGGGRDLSAAYDTTDRITFATGVTAANAVSDLSANRSAMAGTSGPTYGYWAGGNPGVTAGGKTDIIDRIVFATGVTSVFGDTLPTSRQGLAGVSSATDGYWCGGAGFIFYDNIDTIEFATETITTLVTTLTVPKYYVGGVTGPTDGYIAGGDNLGTAYDDVDKLDFTSETITHLASTLSVARVNFPGVS